MGQNLSVPATYINIAGPQAFMPVRGTPRPITTYGPPPAISGSFIEGTDFIDEYIAYWSSQQQVQLWSVDGYHVYPDPVFTWNATGNPVAFLTAWGSPTCDSPYPENFIDAADPNYIPGGQIDFSFTMRTVVLYRIYRKDDDGTVNEVAATGTMIAIGSGGVADIADGDTFLLSDGIYPYTFEFDSNGVVVPGNIPVTIPAGIQAPAVIHAAMLLAINGVPGFGVVATGASPNITLTGLKLTAANVPITEILANSGAGATLTPVGMAGGVGGFVAADLLLDGIQPTRRELGLPFDNWVEVTVDKSEDLTYYYKLTSFSAVGGQESPLLKSPLRVVKSAEEDVAWATRKSTSGRQRIWNFTIPAGVGSWMNPTVADIVREMGQGAHTVYIEPDQNIRVKFNNRNNEERTVTGGNDFESKLDDLVVLRVLLINDSGNIANVRVTASM